MKPKITITTVILAATALTTVYLKFINHHLSYLECLIPGAILTGGLYGLFVMFMYGVSKFDKMNEERD